MQETGDATQQPGFGGDPAGFGTADPPGLNTVSVATVSEDVSRATNALRNAIRAAWDGDAAPSIDTLLVGSGTGTPSRTDTSLASTAFGAATDGETPASSTARFHAFAQRASSYDVAELGLEDDAGGLHARLTTASTLSVPRDARADFRIDVDVGDDPDAQGVVTDAGATLTRDVVADNGPDPPTQLAFGTDDTTPSTSDTALGNEFDTVALDSTERKSAGVIDLLASVTNATGSDVTLREWGLKDANGTLLSRLIYADIILEDSEDLNATQRLDWQND